jgi:3'(2'), 5'-bisphosphate nucleotidase
MTEGSNEDEAMAEFFAILALEAGEVIMRVFDRDPHVRAKGDASPVCDADLLGEEIILKGLARHAPKIPVIAEELCAEGHIPALDGGDFILVDALDGTKEFLACRDTFTVNVALIRGGEPAVGVVYAPARKTLFLAGRRARSSRASPGEKRLPAPEEWRELRTRPMPAKDAIALMSRSHSDADSLDYLAGLPVGAMVSTGSSLKFCTIAAGEADIYPRFCRTMEWDIAAGDAVLRRAGGLVADPQGKPVAYGNAREKFANGPFVAWGDPQAAAAYARKCASGAGAAC